MAQARLPLLLIALLCGLSQGAEFRAGAAAVAITPTAGAPMAGGYSPRVAEGVHDELYAKAIVLECDGVKVAMVVCDLLGMPRKIAEDARALIAQSPGIPAERVMISATHTHTGPIVPNNSARDPQGSELADRANAYAASLPELIARSVRDADAKLAPASVSAGVGREEHLSFNRRYVMADGTVAWNPGKLNPKIVRPTGPIDPDVPVVCLKSASAGSEGKLLATYVNFAMHLDTTGGGQLSADFPHALASLMTRVQGPDCLTVFSTGACGDINHIDVTRPEPQNGIEEARRIGTTLGGEVIKTLERLRPVPAGPLRAASEVVMLDLPQIKPGELEAARKTAVQFGKVRTSFIDRVQAFKVLDVHSKQGKQQEGEVQVIALGDEVAWVALPGEIFVELGLEVKRRSPYRTTIVVELANGYLGYIPTRRAYAEGAYEVVSARVAEGSGERLVETAVRLLANLKAAK